MASTDATQGTSRRGEGMENSVLRFRDVNFTVPSKEKDAPPKYILKDVTGTVRWGRVLAIMGPSGAGKTVLISTLTLDAFFGSPTGDVTLNGVRINDKIFKSHCYVVVQQDKHWPYLTCRETLRYAAELYNVGDASAIDTIVDEVVDKMGLRICADTRNARLSGGQRRRLSIGVALLKQPTVLFLDEPTSGLDNASAESVMNEIVRVAKDERLVILCTIHQPSTKVYNGFDQTMILSKGRVAYNGDVKDAISYFDSIGFPLPPQMNPAEHFMDLVNADFSDDAKVDSILDMWAEQGAGMSSHHIKEDEGQEGVSTLKHTPFSQEMMILFRRHFTLIVRDPLLYSGRCVVFLVANTFFSAVYIKARKYEQDQAQSRFWIIMWHFSVAAQMGAVAVYALNEEFKTIKRETKNGMVNPLSYVIAKTVLVIPIIFIFALFALTLPTFVMMDFQWDAFGKTVMLWAAAIYVYENLAECLAVTFDDPILGMLQFMNFWFGAFLLGGFLLPKDDLFYPFTIFYYTTPASYFARSISRETFLGTTWDPCDPTNTTSAICVDPPTGENVLNALSKIFAIVDTNDHYARDLGVLLAIAGFFKIMFFIGCIFNASKVATIAATKSK